MSGYQSPFYLSNLVLENNIFYAPLAGCSDLPFRTMSKKYRPGLIFCEMVKMDALIRNDTNTFRLLDYEKNMHPIGAQLCGSKVEIASDAARIIEDLGFDVIDLNCGCPVDKVTKDGSGSGLLKTPDLIGEILTKICSSVSIPVTVKIRTGWDDSQIIAPQITKIAEDAGAKAIAVHGRTREQGYKGIANRDIIKECKCAAKNILVIGNGDIFEPAQAEHMFQHTKCDAILVSRGTMGKPWIAEDIVKYFSHYPEDRSFHFIKEEMLVHFSHILKYKTDRQALLDMRRVGCYYLKNCMNVKPLRLSLNKAQSAPEALQLVENFSFNEA